MGNVTPFLWFQKDLEAALQLYQAVLPDVVVHQRTPLGPDGLIATFSIAGQTFIGMQAAPAHRLTEAFSIMVTCEDQAEVDRYWDGLTANGGTPSRCGWLTDRFGLSWQIVPTRLMELQSDPDPARAARVTQAMLAMDKLIIADLESA